MGFSPKILGPAARAQYMQRAAAPSLISLRIKAGKRRSGLSALEFQNVCEKGGLPKPQLEYQFHPTRKWRFDFAWPVQKLAMEMDGGVFMPGGGGHNSGGGFRKDIEKANSAAVMGWRIVRVFPEHLLRPETVDLIRRALRGKCG